MRRCAVGATRPARAPFSSPGMPNLLLKEKQNLPGARQCGSGAVSVCRDAESSLEREAELVAWVGRVSVSREAKSSLEREAELASGHHCVRRAPFPSPRDARSSLETRSRTRVAAERWWGDAEDVRSGAPELVAGEAGAFDQGLELGPADVGVAAAAEAAVETGYHVLLAQQIGIPHDAVGDQLRWFDG
jgi:hypothetical protein